MFESSKERSGFAATKPSQGKLLYHMTKASNLPSIIENGLLPRCELEPGEFEDIANQEIIEKRSDRDGGLERFVPFHFFPRNPFDFAACWKHGTENMVIITIWRSLAEKEGKIIPRHPLSVGDEEIYDYAEGFAKVPWDYLDNYGNRDYSDHEIKTACMAECLIGRMIAPDEFAYIYVPTDEIKEQIVEFSPKMASRISVNPRMFP